MRLATRLFGSTSLLVAATVVGLTIAADRNLRRGLEDETAAALEREARLVASQLPKDSLQWSPAAHQLGNLVGHRVTLIDATGRVRGDADFPPEALPRLENHAGRPEVMAAMATGRGRASRLSVSTNERQLYVAIRGGPPGLTVVRLSTTLAAVDAQVGAVQGSVALAGAVLLILAAIFAQIGSRHLARPLVELGVAARAIADERPPEFPDSRIPEVAQHIRALRAMHEQLIARFTELRREREESAALVEAMADGVIASDVRGEIRTCNAAARRMLRREAGTSLPPLTELFHDKAARDVIRDVQAGQEVDQREVRLADRPVIVTGRPLPGGGVLLVLRDVYQLRHLETMRRDFVANVSHELKTPLTAIAGYAETLVGESDGATHAAQFATTILAHARRMQHLVEDLLDLSRIESGGWHPAPLPLQVEAAARDAWAPFAEAAATNKISFAVSIAQGADQVVADPEALRQILSNLFDNAVRHTPAGGRIRVSAVRAASTIALAVSDTGAGIPSEHLPRIFERFYRVDPARSRAQGGTGLGLAIVKHLVEAHGGRTDAESALGKGTTIRVVFPGAPAVTE